MTSERPRRTRKTRLVMRDGEQVLRANDYDLQEGEKSVWDRELAEAEPDEPLEETTTTKTKKAKKAGAPCGATKRKAAANGAAVGKKKNKVEASEMKALIAEEIAARRDRRAAFALRHAEAMRAFGAKLPTTPPSMAEPATVAAVAPRELTATLRPHQEEGLRFSRKLRGPSLVVCPLSVLSSWMVEFKKFSPSMRIVKLHSSDADERERIRRDVLRNPFGYDVVVTTYEMAKSMATVLGGTTWWRYLILDEGHWCKSETSEISRAVRRVHFGHCLLLTGTPLQNNLHELWALLNLLHPDWLPSSDKFDAAFELNGARAKADPRQLAKAHDLLKPLMLRRLKVDVEKRLPPKVETKIMCPLTRAQAFWYKRLLLRWDADALDELERAAEAGGAADRKRGAWQKLQSLLMQLRKCCNHPYLFEGADPTPGVTDEALVQASGKLRTLDRLLDRLLKSGHRVVIFSQYTGTLDVIDDVLRYREIRYCRLDGGTNRVQRTVDINAYNAPGSRIPVFIMSTRAGGLGINLQTADTCILYDSDWNPQADLQAMARVHRIGQTKTVHVYRLVTAGTVEERIVQRAEKKLFLDRMVNSDAARASDDAVVPNGDNDVGAHEMLSALTFGADAVVNRSDDAEDEDLDDAAIDAIIDRSRDANSSVQGVIEGGKALTAATFVDTNGDYSNNNNNNNNVGASIRELRGVLYGGGGGGGDSEDAGKKRKNREVSLEDIGKEWAEIRAKRVKKQRVVTTKVGGVGEIGVLASSIEADDDDKDLVAAARHFSDAATTDSARKRQEEAKEAAAWEAEAAKAAVEAIGTRQKAGRDYDHESHCLICWDGGDIVCCDVCPTSWHLECLASINFPSPFGAAPVSTPSRSRGSSSKSRAARPKKPRARRPTVGTWACPHHRCSSCQRKCAAAGGLLFRCAVCPQTYCEDHLPANARMLGRCDRFEALGQRHPTQACFILCCPECSTWAKARGEIDDDNEYGTAAGIIGATGMDTTHQQQAAPPPSPVFATDKRADLERLDDVSRAAVMALIGKTKAVTLGEASPRLAGKVANFDKLASLLLATGAPDEPRDDAVLADHVLKWRGAAESREKGVKAMRERVAALTLRIERTLDAMRTYELHELAQLLDVLKLNPPEPSRSKANFNARHPYGVFVSGTSTISRRLLIKVVSLFLAWPRQSSLWVVKATSRMLGEDEAALADREAAKKGPGAMKRRAEAKRIRDVVEDRKRFAINDLFLYPLVPDRVADAIGLPLAIPNITVYTTNVARDAPTIQLRVIQHPATSSSSKKARA